MQRKNKTKLLSVIFICIFIICMIYGIKRVSKQDEKKVGSTVFDVGSDVTVLKYNNKVVELKDEDREEFLSILESVSNDKDVNFDNKED
ncbi:hypothetical protein, partial [Eubacterium sp.]|uniref:hypothetical protein n=1 Tax=Eubacterium sp. TaxID=142586 RepID=UPI0025DEDE91